MAAQALPSVPGYWTISGTLATNYLSRQVARYPELKGQVGVALTGIQCLESTGFFAGNAYVEQDLEQAGVMASLTIPSNVDALGLLKCVVRVIAGGPVEHSDQWSPCYEAFSVDIPLGDGSTSQHFYMFTAGTNQDWCAHVDQLYGSYGKQPLG